MQIYGKNTFKEINNKNKIKNIILSTSFKDESIIKEIKKYNIKYKIVDKYLLDKKIKENHQGIIMEIEDYRYENLDNCLNSNIIVILDHLEDTHNFGAIIRTCEAAGIKNIIIPNKRSVDITPTVYKTSSGALDNVSICKVSNIVHCIKKLKNNGYFIYGCDMCSNNYKDVNYASKTAIVIGNEGKGLSKLVKENCDELISIPMYGKVNSLNASVAAGIVLYEIIHQINL